MLEQNQGSSIECFVDSFRSKQLLCFQWIARKESPFFITADDVNEVIRAFFMMKASAQKSEGDLARCMLSKITTKHSDFKLVTYNML